MTLTTDLAVQASGISYTYDSSQAPGGRINLGSVTVGGSPINPNGVYSIAMSEQVFNFLNSLLQGSLSGRVENTGLFEYNIVRDYMRSLRFVQYKSEGRIKDTNPAPVK